MSLLERQNHERRGLESGQRQYLCQLGESLQRHQELLGQLDRQQGTGYDRSTVLPPLIPKISKPVDQSQPEPEAWQEEVTLERPQDILEAQKVEQLEMEATDAESPVDQTTQTETMWSNQTSPGEVSSLTAESTLESPAADGLPLSALEPKDMSLRPVEMPKSRQLQVATLQVRAAGVGYTGLEVSGVDVVSCLMIGMIADNDHQR